MPVSGLRNRFPYNPPQSGDNLPATLPRNVAAPTRNVREHHPIFNASERNARYPHAGLWLDKYLVFQEKKEEAPDPSGRLSVSQAAQIQKAEESYRAQLVREVADLPIPQIYAQFYQRGEQYLEQCGAKKKEARARGRLIVGLGAESVLETSIVLHRTYGVPYIPGSALKGLAASYLRAQFGEKWREDKIKLQQYKVIFGDADQAGYIIFFDAFYIIGDEKQKGPLYQDILTVHHPDYYKGQGAAPTDTDNPNPVSFLSASGSYLVALAAPDLRKQDRDLWLNATFELLDNALQHWGIGAKTSSGYGRMAFIAEEEPTGEAVSEKQQEVSPSLSPEAQRCLEQLQQIPKAAFNQGIFNIHKVWKTLKVSQDRQFIATAIIERIREEGYEPAKAKKDWYKELVAFVAIEAEGK